MGVQSSSGIASIRSRRLARWRMVIEKRTSISRQAATQCGRRSRCPRTVSIPCGFSSDGMPIGLHIVGRKGDEEARANGARGVGSLRAGAAVG